MEHIIATSANQHKRKYDPLLYHVRVHSVGNFLSWSLYKKDSIEPQYTNKVYSPNVLYATYESCKIAFCFEHYKRTKRKDHISVWFMDDGAALKGFIYGKQ